MNAEQQNLALVRKAKEDGIANVKVRANPEWYELALQIVFFWNRLHGGLHEFRFTADDLWCGLNHRGLLTHEPRAMGAVLKDAQRRGWIEPTNEPWRPSKRVVCHGRPLRVWRVK